MRNEIRYMTHFRRALKIGLKALIKFYEAKYKVFIVGLKMAHGLQIRNIQVQSHS